MNQFSLKHATKILTALLIAFALQACGPTSYKTQRNIVVNISESHEANLAAAEKIVAEVDADKLRAKIRETFPDVTAEHLETFSLKAKVMKIGETNNAMIEAGLSFTDINLPANEIMDFVHKQIEEKVQATR